MKKEMAILLNGNYEAIVSTIQHKCYSSDHNCYCVEYGWEIGKLHLTIVEGDPYEDGWEHTIDVKFCPFCGYSAPHIDN